ncbi:hypothetical protein M8J77_009619 [Diaphorina citri]|nr:hypothetical protein M8J77_009619 [Diaphorina citri]
MDSSSSTSSERRHSVPETYFGKYRTRSPDDHREKMTKDKSIQTDNKLPIISDRLSCSHSHKSHASRKSCSHSHSRRKRFKKINQGDFINMILKNGQVKLKEKYSHRCSGRNNGKSKTDKRGNSEPSKEDIQKLEKQIVRLFSNNSKEDSAKYLSESEYNNLVLPNIHSNEYTRVCYSSDSVKHEDQELQEAILKLQNGEKIVRKTETQKFDVEDIHQDNGDDNNEEYLICFNDNEEISSYLLQSLNDKYSKALTPRSSSDYYFSSYGTTVTDRTISTIQSSSSYREDVRMRNRDQEFDDRVNLPRSPRLFPLVIDAESLLSEPLQSGYIPNKQMKLISVHFLDSDSDNNGTNKSIAITDHSYLLQPTYETKEDVVIFELDSESVEQVNSSVQENYNNLSKNSLISEIKHEPDNKHIVDNFLFNQPTSSVISHKKPLEREEKKNGSKGMDYKSCSCTSAISNIVPQPYRDSNYNTPVVSRLSSLPKSYSMLVNASSKYEDYSSDSSDDEVSNPDSLDEMSSKHRTCYNKHDEKIVRGDTSLVLDRRPRKKSCSFSPYFITLNGDEIYSLHHMKYKLPEEIKKKLMNRERKLRKHSREKCKHCSKASLLKKIIRKKQQLKSKQQQKLAAESSLGLSNEKKVCSKSYCGHKDKIDSKKQVVKKSQESFERHTCSNTIVVHEIQSNQLGSHQKKKYDSENSKCLKTLRPSDDSDNGHKSTQNVGKQSTQTQREYMMDNRKTKLIRNDFTQTSIEESKAITENLERSAIKPTRSVEHGSRVDEAHKWDNSKVRTEKKVPMRNSASSMSYKPEERESPERKDCYCQSKSDSKTKVNDYAQTDLEKPVQTTSKTISDKSKKADDELDKAIMYILLDGLMQGEKENAEKEIKKSIAIQVKSPEMKKCAMHPEVETNRRPSNKYARKFDMIPEEESGLMNTRDVYGSPLDYNDKAQPIVPQKEKPSQKIENVVEGRKIEQCRCIEDIDTREELNKEVAKFEEYLANKKKDQFYSVEECHPELPEIPQENFEPRKFSSVSNVSIESIDMINTSCRRHSKSNGSNPTVLNYKRAMMVGTFTPFNQQEEGSKGKKALTVGEQEELLSKGWINFYLLKGGDSHEYEFFSDAEDDCTFMPHFEMNEFILKEKDTPVESFNVEVKSKPEPVLPLIPTKSKPSQEKKPTKATKRGPLPKLNVKPKRDGSNPPRNAHKNCFLENSENIPMNPKTKRFSNVPDSRRTKRQSVKPQKVEEPTMESTDIMEQNKIIDTFAETEAKDPVDQFQELGTPVDSFVSAPCFEDFDHHKELDPIVKDYDCSIRTVSSISVHSESDESQKQIVRKSSKPERERSFQPQTSAKPCSEHNWKVTVASEKGTNKQSSPNIELHLSMNSSEQSRERRSNPRQTNKMNLSLTLKNFCGDSEMSSSSRQDNFYEKDKTFPEPHDLYSKKRYKNLAQVEETGRSSTALSFHEDQDKDDFNKSSKRTDIAEGGLLSVTGSYITPEMRRKPPTMSEKDLSLYKNSKK